MIWNLVGGTTQNALVQQAIDACDFPFDLLTESVKREGKSSIRVEWADLSRYAHGAENHEHAEGAHTITREVEGRKRVLGLFYLPPYTKIVLDNSLVNWPNLAKEVFLAEGAHAVDYHYMLDRGLREDVWNALHKDADDVDRDPSESGDVGHGHSWFDGPGGYNTWVGEAFMEAFVKTFAPSVPVTIKLAHKVDEAAVREIRAAFDRHLNPTPEVPPAEPEVPPTPEAEPETPPDAPVFVGTGKVFHDKHKRVKRVKEFGSVAEAQAAGLRPCKVCKPA